MKLEANDIFFRYQAKQNEILRGFSFSAEHTERVGIAAPSGFGKTTLCKLLSGYLTPEQGIVLLDNKQLSTYGDYCPVQMIWQQPQLAVNPRQRMQDVLAEGDGVEERVMKELGIEQEWLNRFPAELSGGELQRFCIARALGKRTRFILADEITTMLDLISQSQIWHFLIKEVERREIGLVAVSHNQNLLNKICTTTLDITQAKGRK